MNQIFYLQFALWQLILGIFLLIISILGYLWYQNAYWPKVLHTPYEEDELNQQLLFLYISETQIVPLTSNGEQFLKRTNAQDQLVSFGKQSINTNRPVQENNFIEKGLTVWAIPTWSKKGIPSVLIHLSNKAIEPIPVEKAPIHQPNEWIKVGKQLLLHKTHAQISILTNLREWKIVRLTHRQNRLLRHFLSSTDVLSAKELFLVGWPDELVDEFGLNSNQKERLRRGISQLRKQLEPTGKQSSYIQTVHGIGYKFEQKL